ncbi:hypothetical protein C8T65DRAFT_556842, partial [Cerioporus squamosus]
QTVKMYKKECIELKDLVLKYANALDVATKDVSEDEMDQGLAYSLAQLEDEVARISHTMEELSRKSFVTRVVSTGKYAELLVEYRRGLQDAIALFQVCP